MKKIIFFDIDGTLAHPTQPPASSTVESIRKAKANGHKAFISTGRTFDSIPKAISDIGFDGGIFSAGGIIMLGNTILAQHHMEVKTVETILTLFNEKSVFYVLETADGRFGSENGQRILAEANMENVSKKMQQLTADILLDPIVLPMSEYNGQSIFKIAYHCADADISEQLTSALGGIAKIVQFNNIPGLPITIGEISDPDVNKGNAMMDVCNYYNKTAKDCIAFGDSMNDAEIILAAGTGIAMGNADQQLKDIADMICDSCENDGIAKALCKLSII